MQQLDLIEATRQGNLFSDNDEEDTDSSQPTQLDWQQVMDDIDREMKRLGWDKQKGRQHLIETYGVKSRLYLTDEQLIEFWDYLKSK